MAIDSYPYTDRVNKNHTIGFYPLEKNEINPSPRLYSF